MKRRVSGRPRPALPALLAAVVLLPLSVTAQDSPVRTVDAVDLDRYLGEWYEIARFPNRFQRDCASDVRATYAKREDGRLDVLNRCRGEDGEVIDAKGVARRAGDASTAKLKVRFAPAWLSFLPWVWGDYWILGLGEGYSWAVVGSPDREYLWILARTPSLEDGQLAAARAVAEENGFQVDRLVPTRHVAARDDDAP